MTDTIPNTGLIGLEFAKTRRVKGETRFIGIATITKAYKNGNVLLSDDTRQQYNVWRDNSGFVHLSATGHHNLWSHRTRYEHMTPSKRVKIKAQEMNNNRQQVVQYINDLISDTKDLQKLADIVNLLNKD